jgi:hypothetical protein
MLSDRVQVHRYILGRMYDPYFPQTLQSFFLTGLTRITRVVNLYVVIHYGDTFRCIFAVIRVCLHYWSRYIVIVTHGCCVCRLLTHGGCIKWFLHSTGYVCCPCSYNVLRAILLSFISYRHESEGWIWIWHHAALFCSLQNRKSTRITCFL